MENNDFFYKGKKYAIDYKNAWDQNGLKEEDILQKISTDTSFLKRLATRLLAIPTINDSKKKTANISSFEKKILAHNMLTELYKKSPKNGINHFYFWYICKKVGLPIISSKQLFLEQLQHIKQQTIKFPEKNGPM